MRLIALLFVSLALVVTGPAFAGRCHTGVRTPRSHVVGDRKRKLLLTPFEAARRVGLWEMAIVKEIHGGRLPGKVIGGRWYIDPHDLAVWDSQFGETVRAERKRLQLARKPARQTAPEKVPAKHQAARHHLARGSKSTHASPHLRDRQDPMVLAPEEQPTYYTREEAARYARVHISTIDRARRTGELRDGGSEWLVRIRREWLDDWLEKRRERGR